MKLIPFVGKKDDTEEEKEVVDDTQKKEDQKQAEALEKQRQALHAKIQHDAVKRDEIMKKFKAIEKAKGLDSHFAETCLLLISMSKEIADKYSFELGQLIDWITEQTDGVEFMDIAQARKYFLKLRHEIKKRLEGIFSNFWVINHILSAMLFYINQWYPKGVVERVADAAGSVVTKPARAAKKIANKLGLRKEDKKIRG